MPTNENPKSTHIPETAGAIETVTGSLVVDTGLRNVQSFAVTLASIPNANAASVAGTLADDKRTLTLLVVKADGVTAGSVAASVAWTALGK